MKTYYVDKIGEHKVDLAFESLSELQTYVIRNVDRLNLNPSQIYVHCKYIVSANMCETNVEYFVRMNNRKHTLTTKRI